MDEIKKLSLFSLLFLHNLKNKESPITCYKYNKPIHSAIFIFNKLVTELDIKVTIPDS